MWPSIALPFLHAIVAPYDLARLTAEIACVLLGTLINRRQGIPVRLTVLTALLCPVAVWGARVLDVAEYGSECASVGAAWVRNGSSVYGAFLGNFAVVGIVTWLRRVPLLRFLDGAAPALALGEAITRPGCFCAGCGLG